MKWGLLSPIAPEEVRAAVHMSNSSAGMSAKNLLSSIAELYNLILATDAIPENLAAARVTFIPKTENPSQRIPANRSNIHPDKSTAQDPGAKNARTASL